MTFHSIPFHFDSAERGEGIETRDAERKWEKKWKGKGWGMWIVIVIVSGDSGGRKERDYWVWVDLRRNGGTGGDE